jgi:hypothetical protein
VEIRKTVRGWIYGRYLSLLHPDTPGERGILRRLIYREFHDRLFRGKETFTHFDLEKTEFMGKVYYRLEYRYEREDIITCGTYVYIKSAAAYIRIAETPCSQFWYFFDLNKDGYTEIVALDSSRRSVFVYSEKQREEIFQYALFSQEGGFEITDEIHGSYIEVEKISGGRSCRIIVYRQESVYHPVQKTVYTWNGSTFSSNPP